jgi:peptide/nickel transport system substrate-binding protein
VKPISTCSAEAPALTIPWSPSATSSSSNGPYSATGYANPHVDGLIDAIGTELVTYARDAMIEEIWRTVRDDIVFVPLHQQVIVWALCDELELPVDPVNWPRFRLARLRPLEGN